MASITSVISFLILLLATYSYSAPTVTPEYEFTTGTMLVEHQTPATLILVKSPGSVSVPNIQKPRSFYGFDNEELTTIESEKRGLTESSEESSTIDPVKREFDEFSFSTVEPIRREFDESSFSTVEPIRRGLTESSEESSTVDPAKREFDEFSFSTVEPVKRGLTESSEESTTIDPVKREFDEFSFSTVEPIKREFDESSFSTVEPVKRGLTESSEESSTSEPVKREFDESSFSTVEPIRREFDESSFSTVEPIKREFDELSFSTVEPIKRGLTESSEESSTLEPVPREFDESSFSTVAPVKRGFLKYSTPDMETATTFNERAIGEEDVESFDLTTPFYEEQPEGEGHPQPSSSADVQAGQSGLLDVKSSDVYPTKSSQNIIRPLGHRVETIVKTKKNPTLSNEGSTESKITVITNGELPAEEYKH